MEYNDEFSYSPVSDGYAVFDSKYPISGFVYPGTCDDIAVPKDIDGVPVTELHQTLKRMSYGDAAIEHQNLKRVYLDVSRATEKDFLGRLRNGAYENDFQYKRSGNYANKENLQLGLYFCGAGRSNIELCSIRCDEPLLLKLPAAKTINVYSPKTILEGGVPDCVENISFSGTVYASYGDYDGFTNFIGKKNLRKVSGSLRESPSFSFRDCTSLESVHLSEGIKVISDYSFYNCVSLRDLYIPDSVEKIGEYAFAGCKKLESIHLPSGLKKISKGMFKGCESLGKVFLADSIEIIDDEAFEGCLSLRKPWIPKNIQHISESAFSNPEWLKYN